MLESSVELPIDYVCNHFDFHCFINEIVISYIKKKNLYPHLHPHAWALRMLLDMITSGKVASVC